MKEQRSMNALITVQTVFRIATKEALTVAERIATHAGARITLIVMMAIHVHRIFA
jgi:hypothetical protein